MSTCNRCDGQGAYETAASRGEGTHEICSLCNGTGEQPAPVSATEPEVINESGLINSPVINAEAIAKELAAFRRLLETPDFAAVRKDRAGNFHVRMHRDGESLAWVAPTLDEAATLALQWTGFYEDEPK